MQIGEHWVVRDLGHARIFLGHRLFEPLERAVALGGSRSRGLFVTEAGAIIGMSGVKGHRTHAFTGF